MGLLVGCAALPMALALLVIVVVVLVKEPLALVILAGLGWAIRTSWRAHRAVLRHREERP